jgi:hypothetical protein
MRSVDVPLVQFAADAREVRQITLRELSVCLSNSRSTRGVKRAANRRRASACRTLSPDERSAIEDDLRRQGALQA